jgi:hypothetical protein
VRVASRASRVVEAGRRGDVRRPYDVGGRRADGLAFSIAEGERGMRIVRVVAAGARTVELMGDFTSWEPIALIAEEGGVWVARLDIAPGVHRVNIRIDGGEWIAPPGLSSVADDFGGQVGVFVVR